MQTELVARSLQEVRNGALGSLVPVINKERFINGGGCCQSLLVCTSESVCASKLWTKRKAERKITAKEE